MSKKSKLTLFRLPSVGRKYITPTYPQEETTHYKPVSFQGNSANNKTLPALCWSVPSTSRKRRHLVQTRFKFSNKESNTRDLITNGVVINASTDSRGNTNKRGSHEFIRKYVSPEQAATTH